MQIVIDVPAAMYEAAKQDLWCGGQTMGDALKYGTPLHKGHGRLIDADEIKSKLEKRHDFFINAYGGFNNLPLDEKLRVDEVMSNIVEIYNAPTIIERDGD